MKCKFEGCERTPRAKGYCTGHYQQYLAGLTMKPLKPNRRLHIDEEGRVCTRCDEYKPWSEFYRIKHDTFDGYRSKCKVCHREEEKKNRLAREAG